MTRSNTSAACSLLLAHADMRSAYASAAMRRSSSTLSSSDCTRSSRRVDAGASSEPTWPTTHTSDGRCLVTSSSVRLQPGPALLLSPALASAAPSSLASASPSAGAAVVAAAAAASPSPPAASEALCLSSAAADALFATRSAAARAARTGMPRSRSHANSAQRDPRLVLPWSRHTLACSAVASFSIWFASAVCCGVSPITSSTVALNRSTASPTIHFCKPKMPHAPYARLPSDNTRSSSVTFNSPPRTASSLSTASAPPPLAPASVLGPLVPAPFAALSPVAPSAPAAPDAEPVAGVPPSPATDAATAAAAALSSSSYVSKRALTPIRCSTTFSSRRGECTISVDTSATRATSWLTALRTRGKHTCAQNSAWTTPK
mmetsp:Transcript_4849/g.15695  ORF Transcript_4849/g.15695 Transcript_4849/m.15695 type:complete len:376 (+) Transcript_4849:456-1583(+)